MSGSNDSNNNSEESVRAKHADTVIRNHVIWSMGAGLIPVLIADIFAVSALQMDMIRQLCKVYNRDFSEHQGKAIVTSLTSSTLARIGARSVVKLIPGIGSLIGGVTVSAFAGASTYALGEVFKTHFEMGGTILDFDPEALKKFYKEKFEKGKKVAETWRKEQETSNANEPLYTYTPAQATTTSVDTGVTDPTPPEPKTESNDVVARLKELASLKDQGIITDEEFTQMKKRLIEEG